MFLFFSSYIFYIFFAINFFLIFTPFFNFKQSNFFLIFTFFITFLLILNHPFSDFLLIYNDIVLINSRNLFISSILTLFFIGYLFTLFHTSVSIFNELPLLFLIIFFGFNTLIISNDLIILYLSIELFSLTFYLISTIHQNYYTTEAAIKYFIYNFIAGAFYLLGCVFIYSHTSTLLFSSLNFLFLSGIDLSFSHLGCLFILISFFFKLSIAPFHFWTPDIYQGVLYPITMFFTIFPKFVILSFLLKFYPFFFSFLHSLFLFCGLLSIFIGGFGALTQFNIKRLLAYSTILNSGFFIILISLNLPSSSKIFFFYILTYILANFGLFTFLISLNISNLFGLQLLSSNPLFSILLSLPIFSLAGLPPFIGFFAKFLTTYVLFGQNLLFIVIFSLIASTLSLFYYLRFVHYALFSPSTSLSSFNISFFQSHIIIFSNFGLLFLTFNPSFLFLISSIFSLL